MAREPLYDELYCDGYVTFKSALTRGTDEDKVVKISASKTVALCSDGDNFDGVVRVIAASDKAASVQERGYATLPGTGITFGYKPLLARTDGGVKLNGSPAVGDKYYEVVEVNSTDSTVSIKLG